VLVQSTGKEVSNVLCTVNSLSASGCSVVAQLGITHLDKLSDTLDWPCKNFFGTSLGSIVTQSWVVVNTFENLVDLGFKGLKYLGRVLGRV